MVEILVCKQVIPGLENWGSAFFPRFQLHGIFAKQATNDPNWCDHDIKQDRQKYSRDNCAQGMWQAKPDFCKGPEQAWSRHRHDQKTYA